MRRPTTKRPYSCLPHVLNREWDYGVHMPYTHWRSKAEFMKARAKAKSNKDKMKPLPEIPPRLPPMPDFMFGQPISNDRGTSSNQVATSSKQQPETMTAEGELKPAKYRFESHKKKVTMDKRERDPEKARALKPPVKSKRTKADASTELD